jgi:protease-4
MPTATRPMNEIEKKYFQNSVDTIYNTFIHRVSEGRRINVALVDSIGQGRVWTGTRGIDIGLADKLGGLQDAINCAARMSKLKDFKIKEYPEPLSWLETIFGGYKKNMQAKAVKEELGEQGANIYQSVKKVKQMVGSAQARLPFELIIN